MDAMTPASQLQLLLDGDERWWIDKQVDDLERRICSLRERQMRRSVAVEAISTLDASELVALLSVLLGRVSAGRGPSREVLQELALEPVVFTDLPYELLAEAYRVARQGRQDQVAGFFLGGAPPAIDSRTVAPEDNAHLDLPLGVRRSAARSRDRFVLDRLVHDRNPKVIALLLNNPRIIERDVIKIAATRPTSPAVLHEVARHRKWASSYRVRKALACNPYTSSSVARRLLPTLMRQDLLELLNSKVLGPELRHLARQLTEGEG